jgi:hypothetical protein
MLLLLLCLPWVCQGWSSYWSTQHQHQQQARWQPTWSEAPADLTLAAAWRGLALGASLLLHKQPRTTAQTGKGGGDMVNCRLLAQHMDGTTANMTQSLLIGHWEASAASCNSSRPVQRYLQGGYRQAGLAGVAAWASATWCSRGASIDMDGS